MSDFEIATSTPPFWSSFFASPPAGARPSSAAMSAPLEAVVTGARKRMIGSPPVVSAFRISVISPAGVSGRFLMEAPFWARMAPFASRIIAPTTSESSVVPEPMAPSRNWVSSGLSSVSTPYLLL